MTTGPAHLCDLVLRVEPATRASCRPRALQVSRRLVLAATCAAALGLRLVHLGAAGFAEDEIAKLRAIEAYRRGDFSANAEHPMLMKLAAWTSLALAERWNQAIGASSPWAVASEAAVRLPNALAGAGTTILIFLVAERLFGAAVGAWAATLWALDVNAVAINRLAKEDTLLLFFLLAAFWLHLRGTDEGQHDPARAQRWHAASGAALGLMLATKYMPHYVGLHALYRRLTGVPDHPGRLRRRWFYPPMLAAFLLANFGLLLPSTWQALAGYVRGDLAWRTGYPFAGRLYPNRIGATPWGLPPWFYLAYFVTKIPVPVLAAAGVGLWQLARRPQHPGAVFVRVMLVPLVLGYSLVATKFLRYMLPVLAVLDVAAAVGLVWLLAEWRPRRLAAGASRWLGALMAAAVLAGAATASLAAAPQYGLYRNVVGRAVAGSRLLFPEDELSDAGMREAVAYVASRAARGAVVASDAPGVVSEYLRRCGRSDLEGWSLSRRGLPLDGRETWVLVQDGRLTFENAALVEWVRRHLRPVREVRLRDVVAVQIYRSLAVRRPATRPGPLD